MFKTFITHKFLEFEKSTGRRCTVTEFAASIGEPQGNVSHWLNGTRVPQGAVLKRLQRVWGDEVYQAALPIDIMPDDPLLRRTVQAMQGLPLAVREQIANLAEQQAREHEQSRNNIGSLSLA